MIVFFFYSMKTKQIEKAINDNQHEELISLLQKYQNKHLKTPKS